MENKKKDYSDSQIRTILNLDYIRLRPSAYIPDVGVNGQFSLIKELLDNAFDEMNEKLKPSEGNIDIFLLKEDTNYIVAIYDNGRGVPLNSLQDSFTVEKTSGKFDTESYKYSSGMYGIGAKATVALSRKFRAISFREDGVGDLLVKNGKDIFLEKYDPWQRTGMFLMTQPNPAFLSEIERFKDIDYIQITNFLELMSLFSKFRMRFWYLDKGYNNLWDMDVSSLIKYFANIDETVLPVFDNSRFSKMDFIIKHFKTPEYSHTLSYSDNDLIFTIEVYSNINYIIPQNANKISLVNNVPFASSDDNLHTSMFYSRVLLELSKRVTEKEIINFVINEYKVPINVLMNVKFSGAKFTGTTKHLFKDITFKEPYRRALDEVFSDSSFIDGLYEYIKDDISLKYNLSINKQFINIHSNRQLLLDLNRPTKFSDCNTSDRTIAELFLAEGDSAKSDKGRNPEDQAIYALQGKPLNSLLTMEKINISIAKIKSNAIFSDIIKLTGIIPGSDNLSKLRYDKVFIMTDADVHGYHIANILIANFCILCPKFVEEGHLYIVIPPLYGLKSKNNGQMLFVKDYEHLVSYLAENIYSNIFDIYLSSPTYEEKLLSKEDFVGFTSIVLELGTMLHTLGNKLNISSEILEILACSSELLNGGVNEEEIKRVFDANAVHYDSINEILTLSIGSEDIIIPLRDFGFIIYEKLLPYLNEYLLNKMEIKVSTRHSDVLNKTPMSITNLYSIFTDLDKQFFEIERYKGLGRMMPVDRCSTCMDKKTRRTYQIKSIGDLNRIFELLGKDSQYRKELLL